LITSNTIVGIVYYPDYELGQILYYVILAMSFVTDAIIIYYQWYYILFFISKKKLKLKSEKKQLDRKVNCLFCWLYFVLAINTLNYLFGYVYVILLEANEYNNKTVLQILQLISRFSVFWTDTLNLSNALIFLLLFRSMIKVNKHNYKQGDAKEDMEHIES
jgi:hypothetical protein